MILSELTLTYSISLLLDNLFIVTGYIVLLPSCAVTVIFNVVVFPLDRFTVLSVCFNSASSVPIATVAYSLLDIAFKLTSVTFSATFIIYVPSSCSSISVLSLYNESNVLSLEIFCNTIVYVLTLPSSATTSTFTFVISFSVSAVYDIVDFDSSESILNVAYSLNALISIVADVLLFGINALYVYDFSSYSVSPVLFTFTYSKSFISETILIVKT